MEEIIVREILPADPEQALAYLCAIGGETDNLTFGAEGLPLSAEEERNYLQHIHANLHSVHYGAWRNGILIADGSLTGMPGRMRHRAELGISVRKEYWNQGLGSRMMEQLITYAENSGIEVISLDVRADNAAAIHLYRKYGFRTIGTFPAYFRIGDQYYDFDMMLLDLRRVRNGEKRLPTR